MRGLLRRSWSGTEGSCEGLPGNHAREYEESRVEEEEWPDSGAGRGGKKCLDFGGKRTVRSGVWSGGRVCKLL